MTRKAYQQFIEKSKNGDAAYLRIKQVNGHSSNVLFFGANYDNYFPIKNLYKALNTIRPDALLLQIAPDTILDNFTIENKRSGDEQVLDAESYVSQLRRQGYELHPSLHFKDEVEKLLKMSGLRISGGPMKQTEEE